MSMVLKKDKLKLFDDPKMESEEQFIPTRSSDFQVQISNELRQRLEFKLKRS